MKTAHWGLLASLLLSPALALAADPAPRNIDLQAMMVSQ